MFNQPIARCLAAVAFIAPRTVVEEARNARASTALVRHRFDNMKRGKNRVGCDKETGSSGCRRDHLAQATRHLAELFLECRDVYELGPLDQSLEG